MQMSGLSRCRAPQQQNVALQKRSSRWESPLPALSVQSRRVARAHRSRVLRLAPPPPPKGESAINLPEQCFPRRGRKKSLAGKRGRAGRKKHPARNGRRRRARGMGRQGPCSASLLMLLAPPVPSRRHTDSLALSMFSMREDWQ